MHLNKRWLEKKAARQETATKNVCWNRYSIHDHDAVKKRLAVQHKAKQDVAAKLGQPIPTDRDFALAVLQNEQRRLRFIGATGGYAPHQGKQACARRVRQGG